MLFLNVKVEMYSVPPNNQFFYASAFPSVDIVYAIIVLFVEVPAVVVGVVGMGHVPGIERNWDKQLNINEIMRYVSHIVCTQ